MSFWGELKRRNVFKVGAAYVIVAWLLAQVVSLAFPAFHMPQWTVTFVMSLLILGLPVTLIIAWAFELTPDGVKRSENVPLDESITHVTGRKLNYIVTGLLVVAVAYIFFDNLYLDRRVAQTDAPKTIAVLPFSDLSPEKDQGYFVDGLSEELLNCLAKIDGLRVTSRTSSFAFKDTAKTLQEVVDVLGVDHVLEGSVRKDGDALRITAQLIHVKDDSHLWSETYDRELKDIFDLQEEIATAVANELKVTLGIEKSFRQMGVTNNIEAYEFYLAAKGTLQNFDPTKISSALESIEASIAIDPEFAQAWALKGFAHVWLSIFGPNKRSGMEQNEALHAALKAIELEPNLATAYYVLGNTKMSKADWINAELAYRKAIELTTGDVSAFGMQIEIYYLSVGNSKKSYEILEQNRRNDPMNELVLADYVYVIGLRLSMQKAEDEYRRCKALFGGNWLVGDGMFALLRICSGEIVSPDEIPDLKEYGIIWPKAKEHFESPAEGIEELRRLFNDSDDLSSSELQDISQFAAYFEDPEFSMAAMEKAVSKNASNIFIVWSPLMRPVRQLPRFKEFVREIGLVDYWKQFGWPDLCHPTEDGDFVCD